MQDSQARAVDIRLKRLEHVHGGDINLHQSGAQRVESRRVNIRQGGVFQVTTDTLRASQSGIAISQSQDAVLVTSQAGLVLADEVTLEQGAARLVMGRSDITLNQGRALALIAPKASVKNSATVFLIAGQIEGKVTTLFGPRAAAVFGAAFGLVATVMWRLLRRK